MVAAASFIALNRLMCSLVIFCALQRLGRCCSHRPSGFCRSVLETCIIQHRCIVACTIHDKRTLAPKKMTDAPEGTPATYRM
ncbi:hypothetical protein PR003_g34103 [Phytophthora rubi]|uniref:Secreted protein n=1 Tax=Phytophthora rubi TaxID=129364 RepID=A0A6A3G400_9STRA|nr:hypothetical protein PR002_g32469 [Phytophthora rubi]KAE9261037.1 hypothetical protein PR003_g34103 [Phytophthora rubi]